MIISHISGALQADRMATFTHAGGGGRRWRWPLPPLPQVHTYTWLHARQHQHDPRGFGSTACRETSASDDWLLYQRGETSNQETSCTRGRLLIHDRKSIHVLVVHGRWALTLRSEWQKKKRKMLRDVFDVISQFYDFYQSGGGHICVRWPKEREEIRGRGERRGGLKEKWEEW